MQLGTRRKTLQMVFESWDVALRMPMAGSGESLRGAIGELGAKGAWDRPLPLSGTALQRDVKFHF